MQNYLFNRFLYCVVIETVIRKSSSQYFRKDIQCLPYNQYMKNKSIVSVCTAYKCCI